MDTVVTQNVMYSDAFHPLLISSWYGESTIDEVQAFLDWLQANLERARSADQKLILLCDVEPSNRINAAGRSAISHWRGELGALRPHLDCAIVVISSAFVRGTLTALQWFRNSRNIIAVKDRQAAIVECVERMRTLGAPCSPKAIEAMLKERRAA